MELQSRSFNQQCLLVESTQHDAATLLAYMQKHDVGTLLLMLHNKPVSLLTRQKLKQLLPAQGTATLAELPLPALPESFKADTRQLQRFPISALFGEEQQLYLANLEALLIEYQGNVQRLREQLSYTQSFFNSAAHAIVIADSAHRILAVNPGFERLLGQSPEQVIGESIETIDLRHDLTRQPLKIDDLPQDTDGTEEIVVEALTPKGERLFLQLAMTQLLAKAERSNSTDRPEHSTPAYGLMLKDITREKARQAELNNLAYFDPASKLPNRLLLTRRIAAELETPHKGCALLLVGISNLTSLSEGLGSDLGQQLLFYIGGRLRALEGSEMTIARSGEAEFAVLLPQTHKPDPAQVQQLRKKIQRALSSPLLIGKHTLKLKFYIGQSAVNALSDSGSDQSPARPSANELLLQSGLALREAQAREQELVVYSETLKAKLSRQVAMESGLRRALDGEQLELFYQPRYDTFRGQLLGVEALMRWNQPGRGLIPPNEFIPLAEEKGLIDDLGLWALESACLQWLSWQKSGLNVPHLSVNISALQFQHGKLPQQVHDILERTRFPADKLELELTESCFIEDMDSVRVQLVELAAMGASIAIDDFGTGFSNLSYLHHLPVNKLKIDRSFLSALDSNQQLAAILKATIEMSHCLGLEVTAEGVESEAQLALLAELGCDEVQGFLLSRPLPAHQLTQNLTQKLHDSTDSAEKKAS